MVEYGGDLWHQKTRLPELSCDFLSVIILLAVLVELRLVTDRHRPWLVPRMHSTLKGAIYAFSCFMFYQVVQRHLLTDVENKTTI